MRKGRLLKVATLLEADAVKSKGVKFDLKNWARPAAAARSVLPAFKAGAKPALNCQTAACAIGLVALSGIFAKQGFRYEVQSFNGYFVPTYRGNKQYSAVTMFFDLSEHEAKFLFSHERYPVRNGAKAEIAVAGRIRDFVAGRVTA